ncbi:MAG: DUF21 domain-containing protein [Gammaproteobacteria bacterium AqS3]|nr:DUF21 domain-containing protein [Gammaproteobacteria bacterium AqS3]
MESITPFEALAIASFLLALSAVFAGSEIAMTALNRYRVRHWAKSGSRTGRWVYELIRQPERVIGVILISNNLMLQLATALVTLAVADLWGREVVGWAMLGLAAVVLIFAEIIPKTLGAQNPDFIARPMALPLKGLLWVLAPAVWGINQVSSLLLRLFPDQDRRANDLLSLNELRTLVKDSGELIPEQRRSMLLNIIDLERMMVRDVMTPRSKVVGIDLNGDIESAVKTLTSQPFNAFPVYWENLSRTYGMLSSRRIGRLLSRPKPSMGALRELCERPYYVPEVAALHQQLSQFRQRGRSQALVVDEYGDVQGLVTREDILEEIVGEFNDGLQPAGRIAPQRDGSCYADGDAAVREVNRRMGWKLPMRGSVTLYGLVIEHLEQLPEGNLCTVIAGHRIETKSIRNQTVLRMRISPPADADADADAAGEEQ